MRVIVWLVALMAQVHAADLYVSPTGDDANPGTKARPFATLERAREAARGKHETVWLRGGTYRRTSTLELGKADSGTVFRAYKDEEVRLTGGVAVNGWRPAEDPRIPVSARAHVKQADLKAQGISDFGKMVRRGFGVAISPAALELFCDDKPMPLAGWPNGGWATIAGVPAGQQGAVFTYDGDRPSAWAGEEDVWVHGYWTYDWADSYEKVKSIGPAEHAIVTEPPHGVYGYTKGKRFRVLNVLQELDSPGEWYLDRETGILYFWPPGDGKVTVSLIEKPLISIRDASNVRIEGVTLECVRGTGIEVTGGIGNVIDGCTIRNIGTVGAVVNGGKNNGLDGCDICETGDGGVQISGGDRMTLTPAGNYVVNCEMHDFSRWDRTYRPAVLVSGVGNHIAHCRLHDNPHSAIILSGNDHVIEFNEVYRVCRETGDAGAFYMGRNMTQRGNVIRYNYFHDLASLKDQSGWIEVMAVYLDDCTCGTTVYGNVFYRASWATMIGGGRDNMVMNNMFVECGPSVHVDARATNWASFWFNGKDPTLINGLNEVHYDKPPYSGYAGLANVLADEPAIPKGNLVMRNICVGGKWLDLADGLTPRIVALSKNLLCGISDAASATPADTVAADPGFASPLGANPRATAFRLKDSSPAFKLGFKPLPLGKIGLYRDRYRKQLPKE